MTEVSPEPRNGLIELVENILAPEMYASGAAFFALGDSVLTITFTSTRWDNSTNPGRQKRVVVGRLVLPINGAQDLAAGLYDYLSKHGLDPA